MDSYQPYRSDKMQPMPQNAIAALQEFEMTLAVALESSDDLSAFANAKACRSNDSAGVCPPFPAEKALVELRGSGVRHINISMFQYLTVKYCIA